MTDGGYATSPSWSPNGQFIAFAWNRKYGPGAPGGQDIYVMEVASKRWIQLTHDGGRCDFPSWSPDGRHIAYANTTADGRDDHMKIWTMLADGTQKRMLFPQPEETCQTGAGSEFAEASSSSLRGRASFKRSCFTHRTDVPVPCTSPRKFRRN